MDDAPFSHSPASISFPLAILPAGYNLPARRELNGSTRPPSVSHITRLSCHRHSILFCSIGRARAEPSNKQNRRRPTSCRCLDAIDRAPIDSSRQRERHDYSGTMHHACRLCSSVLLSFASRADLRA